MTGRGQGGMMTLRDWALVAALAVMLPGCATRGPISLTCPIFDSVVTALPPSPLERDIQSDAPPPVGVTDAIVSHSLRAPPPTASDPLTEAFRRARPQREATITPENGLVARAATPPKPVQALLLSGGGQWGAFGAGFLSQLQSSPRAIDPQIITGVSTGGLQSIFVALNTPEAYQALVRSYSPASQSDLVNANPAALAAITGSMAGISPLRSAIEGALCTGGDPARGCPMIDALAVTPRQVLIGFVEAESGRFMVADINSMARHAAATAPRTPARTEANRVARDCITGAALASAGMPLFFQPVRIGNKVYYDGGVRQSVFLASVAEAAARAAAVDSAPPATLYVIRNGPTQLLGKGGVPGNDEDVNTDFTAITAALRTQSIIVNQVEVGSIASLRLFHPQGAIHLATADGYNRWTATDGTPQQCIKGKERFFNPAFMACLRAFGKAKAQRNPSPWIDLRAIIPPPPAP